MKLKLSHLFIAFFLFVNSTTSAQNKIKYEPLKCEGKIPDFFKQTYLQKFEAEKLRISSSNEKNKKKEIKYAEKYEYFFDNLITKGHILYGDVITNYLNDIAKNIMKANKDIDQNFRIFTMKHGGIKILSDNKNNIYVSLAVVSEVENEAQLAYLISQEMAHIALKHKYDHFYYDFEAFSIGNGALENRLGNVLFNDEDQYESDKLALDYIKKTDYKLSESIPAFSIYTVEDPFMNNTVWSNLSFEDSFYRLAEKYHTNAYENEEKKGENKEVEEFFEKRTAKVETALNKIEDNDGKLYIQNEDLFDFIQQQTRVELLFNYIKNGYYLTAYMAAYQYQNLYKETSFTNKIMAYSMFQKALGNYVSHKKSDDDKSDEEGDRYENARKALTSKGETYKLQHLLVSLTDRESGIISVREAWRNYQINKGDSFSLRLVRESVRELFENVDNFEYSDFLHMDKMTKLSDSLSKKSKDSSMTKASKLKLKSQYSNINYKNLNYEKTCFAELLNDTLFNRILKEEKEQAKLKKSVVENIEEVDNISKFGIDSICLISPSYNSFTMTGNSTEFDIVENEEKSMALANEMLNNLSINKLNLMYINLNDRSNFSTETFNILSGYNWYMGERVNNYGSQVYFTSQYINDLTKQYAYMGKIKFNSFQIGNFKGSNYIFYIFNLNNGVMEVNKENFNFSKYKQKKAMGYIRTWLK